MLLQFSSLDSEILRAHAEAGALPPVWRDMSELESAADAWVRRLREERSTQAREHGGQVAIRELVDRVIRTERAEYIDREDTSPGDKVAIVESLHFLNRVLFSYHRFLRALLPHVERVAAAAGRPARLLELASGSGEFTLALAELARDRKVPVDVTGSDVVPAYVEKGRRAAAERGLGVEFRRLNAFDMHDLEPGAYDLVFIAQSMHHFSPGQLAMMIAQARRVAPAGFVGIDGHRSVMVLGSLNVLGVAGAFYRGARHRIWHDAVTSGRKFFSDAELELIARIAAPQDEVRVSLLLPGFSVLEITPR